VPWLIPRRCELGLGEDLLILPTLGLPSPQAFFVVSRSFVGVRRGARRPGTRRDAAWRARGRTRTWPKVGCSAASSTIAASIALSMQFFKNSTQAVQRRPWSTRSADLPQLNVIQTHLISPMWISPRNAAMPRSCHRLANAPEASGGGRDCPTILAGKNGVRG
jgi:hypothetical protein